MLQETVTAGIQKEGSNLSGVSAKCWWEENVIGSSPTWHTVHPTCFSHDSFTGKDVGTRFPVLPPISAGTSTMQNRTEDGRSEGQSACGSVSDITRTGSLRGIHLRFGLEAAMLLPLALR